MSNYVLINDRTDSIIRGRNKTELALIALDHGEVEVTRTVVKVSPNETSIKVNIKPKGYENGKDFWYSYHHDSVTCTDLYSRGEVETLIKKQILSTLQDYGWTLYRIDSI